MGRVHLHTGKSRRLYRSGTDTEAAHDFLDLGNGERHRLAKLAPGHTQLHRGRRFRVRIDHLLGLAAGVADLRPEVIAVAGRRLGPAGQRRLHGRVGLPVDDHVAGALQVVRVHLDIAGQQHARTAVTPQAVEPLQLRGGDALRRRQPLGHCSLG